ncbi:MAG: OmpA family protein [Polyangiaceae bacterium]|jgi:outer membrane protein OmpA-like peptidoglycan-associated protein|nr:OmpA family protein [Polyangiaceae bacterium]
MNETAKSRALPRRPVAVVALLAAGFAHLVIINFVLAPALATTQPVAPQGDDAVASPTAGLPAAQPPAGIPLAPGALQPQTAPAGAGSLASPLSAPDRTAAAQAQQVPPLRIGFLTGFSLMTDGSRAVINQAVVRWQATPSRTLVVVGHADSRGEEEENLALSRHRAMRVADVLLRAGVPQTHIEIRAEGERSPLSAEDTPEAWARNRRVEILLR